MIAMVRPMSPVTDRATLDRNVGDLCTAFDIAWTYRASWDTRSSLRDLVPGHPAFVLRKGSQGLGLDTQCWDISGGEACWPTTRILSLLPWWRQLAEQPAQRCLIPLTACTATRTGRHGGSGQAMWFTLDDASLFTVAGLWREARGARCFAMLGCLGDETLPIMPVVIASKDREPWLHGAWDEVTPLLTPCDPRRLRIGLPEPSSAPYDGNDRDRPRASLAGR